MARKASFVRAILCWSLVLVLVLSTCIMGWAAASTGVTNVIANLRDAPNLASKPSNIIATVAKGKMVTIIDKSSSWYYVEVAGYKGYIYKDYIDESVEAPVAVGSFATMISKAAVYSTASSSARKTGSIGANVAVEVLEVSGSFSKVKATNGKTGYVSSNKLRAPKKGVVLADSATVYKSASEKSAEVSTVAKNAAVNVLRTTSAWYLIQYGTTIGYVKSGDITIK